jgi:predicted  nucleic acid-binding Zn-ribbon protein
MVIETTCKTCGEIFIHGGVFPISECESCQMKKPPAVYKHSSADEKLLRRIYTRKPRKYITGPLETGKKGSNNADDKEGQESQKN